MPSITINAATLTDTVDVIRLFGELHHFNASLDPRFELAGNWEQLVETYIEQLQQSNDSAWLLARHEHQTIGFVLVEVHTDSPLYRHRHWAEIVGLYVTPEYRGSNVAHLLMDRAYDWAVQHNLRVMQLYVTAANQRAHAFYSKQGFEDSQLIMRRWITQADLQDDVQTEHSHHRLHFSEGGGRPIDMHGHTHEEEPRTTS